MMYATSTVKQSEWEKVSESLGHAFNSDKLIDDPFFSTSLGVFSKNVKLGMSLDYLHSIIENKIAESPFLKSRLFMNFSGNKLTISLKDNETFKGHSSDLSEDAQVTLYLLGDILQKVPNQIEIVSFVNPTDKKNAAKNWQLALKRANTVAQQLRSFGNTSRINASINFEDNTGVLESSRSLRNLRHKHRKTQHPSDKIHIIVDKNVMGY